MKISELIQALEEIKKEHGNLDVAIYIPNSSVDEWEMVEFTAKDYLRFRKENILIIDNAY